MRRHERACRLHSTIQIDGRHDRFQPVHQQRLLGSSAAHLLAPAQFQELAEVQPPGHAMQVRGAHQVSLQAREISLVIFREAAHQRLGDQKAQHRVAEELQLLVVVERRSGAGAGPVLVGQGTMGKRAAQQLRVVEPIVQFQLE